ncbi:MAG: AMP-binding protein [Brevibacillus sp.]|nr:AMP-binding protein [Brevibacillus sp.]
MRRSRDTERLRSLVRHAYENSKGWRNRLDEQGISPEQIVTEDDLVRLPVLRKEQLPALQRQFPPFAGLAVDEPPPVRIFLSPGPIYDPQPGGEDPWRFAPALAETGFGDGDVVLNTFSYHLSPAGFMFDSALRALRAAVVPTGVGNTELLVGMLRDLAVTGYVGTPSYFLALGKRAEQEGFRFGRDIRLCKAFFTAEPLPAELADWCRERSIAFGEAYGTADAGCIGYRVHPERGLRIQEDVLIQICDPDSGEPLPPGEVGEVVITLFDEVYPLIRFATGDLSCWLDEEKSRLAGVLGRVGDGVKVRGMFIYRQQLDNVLNGFPQVFRYQAVVSREEGRDHLEIRVELKDGHANKHGSFAAPDETLTRIAERVREVTRIRAAVTMVPPGTLEDSVQRLCDVRAG